MTKDKNVERSTGLEFDSLSLSDQNSLREALSRGASRRDAIKMMTAMGLSLAAAGTIVTGASNALAATPKKGGRLRVALTGGATSDILDPGQILDLYMIHLQFGQLRNNMTEVSASGELVPELAESWEGSNSAKTWNFKIREGVEFHNGKTLDANDIVANLHHHTHADSASAGKALLSGIESFKADGKKNVVVQLSSPDADFPFLLSDYHLCIVPSDGEGNVEWKSGVGTGGYTLQDHEAGVRSFTKRNPNYWKEGKAHFDEVEILQVADVNARTTALQTDDVDCMNNVDVKTIELLKRVAGLTVRSVTGNKQITLPMRTDTAPYDNNDVRLALKHIVDRQQWLDTILRGYGELGNDNPIGPANIYRATTDELPQRDYDPEKAKYHLKKAGMSSLAVQFHAAETGFGGSIDAAQLMRETAKEANIDIEIVREPNDGYWSDVWMNKPWCACYWSGRPTENMMFSTVYKDDAAWNDTYWKHDRFNELLLMGRAETDPTKRREIYVEMQRIVHHEGGVLLPLFQSDNMAYTNKLAMPDVIGNNWELDGAKNAERWWFA